MSSLRDRLLKASTLEHTAVLENSKIYNERDVVPTPIPGLNIAYSASVEGGISSGLHVWAGPSRHFKSMFMLISAASYLHKYPDAICKFYDNEFGSPEDYFRSVGIDPKRVIHSPFTTLEELRTDIVNTLNEVKRGDKVVIAVDSLGMAASNKEKEDAEEGSDKADMTRAKVNKSLFRIVTPHLRIKDIPMMVVQHTYVEQKMYGKTIVSGGTGTMLAAENVYIIGRQAERDGMEIEGYNFIINIEKSRYVKEKAKIPITVKRNGGIERYGGMFELALLGGFIIKNNSKSYSIRGSQDKYTKKELSAERQFWADLMEDDEFRDFIRSVYAVSRGNILDDENVQSETVIDEQYLDEDGNIREDAFTEIL